MTYCEACGGTGHFPILRDPQTWPVEWGPCPVCRPAEPTEATREVVTAEMLSWVRNAGLTSLGPELADAIEARDAEIARLREEVERLRADAERVDWLERNQRIFWDPGTFDVEPVITIYRVVGGRNDRRHEEIATGDTIRKAIDSAREPKP